MCGIAGFITEPRSGPPAFDELRAMLAMLRHRGPDEYGLYRDQHVALGHMRLSIIDLAGGAQPLANEDETVWVTFNGEIFNYLELRQELEACGHRFQTRSDTEVIVHAYEQYGPDAWRRFNGQFAFGLWDRRRRQLWLVRDRLGILPLIYAPVDGGLVFASEAKAIFAGGRVTPRFDSAALLQVFTLWSAPAPATVFAGVHALPPATAMCIDEHLHVRTQRYWELDLQEDPAWERRSVADAADALGAQLSQAVRLRLRADVPVGAYLSGGLDSSTIADLIRTVDQSPLQTFAIRFADAAFDETPEQRRMAERLGTQHHEILCGADEIQAALPDVVWHCETPLLRTAPVPLFLLSGLVRARGMKVVLTGEGADEFLAGYDIFKEDRLRRSLARQPDSQRRARLMSRLYQDVAGAHDSPLWSEFFARGSGETDHPYYSHRLRWENTGWSVRFLAPDVQAAGADAILNGKLAATLPSGWRSWPPLARAQALEIATFMSPYLLCSQGDRVAMGHGVEVRYPFLDPDVVEFCSRLPGRLKLRGLYDKVALRVLASRTLPATIWKRPKRPYRAPMTTALFAPGAHSYVDELLSPAALRRYGLVDTRAAERLVAKARTRKGHMSGEREEMALVGLLTLQLLAHHVGDGLGARAARQQSALQAQPPRVRIDQTQVAVQRTEMGVGLH